MLTFKHPVTGKATEISYDKFCDFLALLNIRMEEVKPRNIVEQYNSVNGSAASPPCFRIFWAQHSHDDLEDILITFNSNTLNILVDYLITKDINSNDVKKLLKHG